MEAIFSALTQEMRLNPGIKDDQIIQVTLSLIHPLPKEFRSFLKFSNGAVGMIGEHYLEIVKAEDLADFNSVHFVPIDAPGLLIFGTDGGLEAYGFDYRKLEPTVVMVPFIGMEWDQAIEKGNNFLDFLQKLSVR